MVTYLSRSSEITTSQLPSSVSEHFLENSIQDFITSYFISSKIGVEVNTSNAILSGVVGSELKKALVEKIIKARFSELTQIENRLSVA